MILVSDRLMWSFKIWTVKIGLFSVLDKLLISTLIGIKSKSDKLSQILIFIINI